MTYLGREIHELSKSLLTNPNVAFCLASSSKRFIYHSTYKNYASDNNLDNTVNIAWINSNLGGQYGVKSEDLVPTYRVGAILDAMESKYNLSFTGAIRSPYIDNYRLLLNQSARANNNDKNRYYPDLTVGSFDFTSPLADANGGYLDINMANVETGNEKVIKTTDRFKSDNTFVTVSSGVSSPLTNTIRLKQRGQLRVCVQTSLTDFEVHIKRDGETIATITENQPKEVTNNSNFYQGTDTRIDAVDHQGAADYTFEVVTNQQGSVDISYRFGYRNKLTYGTPMENIHLNQNKYTAYTTITQVVTTTGDDFINVAELMPKFKVKDFLGTLIKQFNLVPEIADPNADIIEVNFKHFDYYIHTGTQRDITEYVDINSTTVKPSNLYSGINFEHKAGKSAMSEAFYKVNRRNYGDLNYEMIESQNRVATDMFEMKLPTSRIPVEDLSNIDTGLSLNLTWLQLTDLNSNRADAGIVFLYLANHSSGSSVSFNNGTSVDRIITPIIPSNIYFTAQSVSSQFGICGNFWGFENDEIYNDNRYSGLGNFNCFWDNYISIMFDTQTRKVSTQAILPQGILLGLEPSDILQIQEKYYMIESFEANISTGQTKLELIGLTNEMLDLFKARQLNAPSGLPSNTRFVYMKASNGELATTNATTFNAIGIVKNSTN